MYTKTLLQKRVEDLEISIMSCLLIEPKLMQELIVTDEHFIKYKKYWLFMKAFYKKFGNFDINLMYAIAKNKYQIFEFLTTLVEVEPSPLNFLEYQKELIELYEERKKDKYIIEKVYELASDLYLRNISVNDFKESIEKIYADANEIFKEEENE